MRDPEKRRAYNQQLALQSTPTPTSYTYASTPRTSSPTPPYIPTIPVHCENCGRSDATLRLAAFPYVISLVIFSTRQGDGGLYCETCRRQKMVNAKLTSALLGWWGIPFGPIWTLGVLFENGGGKMSPNTNSRYLAGLGVHFLQMGNLGEAEAALNASLSFQHDSTVETLLDNIKEFSGRTSADETRYTPTPERQAKNRIRWGWIVALLFVAFIFFNVFRDGSPATSTQSPSGATSVPAISGTITRAAVPLYVQPYLDSEIKLSLTNGTRVSILGQRNQCEWLLVNTGSKIGWIFATRSSIRYITDCTEIPLGDFQSPGVAPQRVSPPPAEPTSTSPAHNGVILRGNVRLHSQPYRTSESLLLLGAGTIVPIHAQQFDCDWLLVTADHQQGWIRAIRTAVRYAAECDAIPLGIFRPNTGMLKSVRSDEYGVLEIKNDGTEDAVIILTTLANVPVSSAYVRSEVTFEINEIPDGEYWVYVASGTDWNGKGFTRSVVREKFEDVFVYETTTTHTPGWTIGLAPRIGGNADVDPVAESSFPDIE